ncbi:MAG TPA: sulfite exporter TauE/SafE family protein [Deltaproteobacteria bacterium]|nr:sulfite exporter TauE/SafE family protein [Deltaproteobacteria bacterium]
MLLLFVGLGSGIVSGIFGIGGGVIIVPALVYLVGLPQHTAIGTSLAILLPPVGLAAVIEFYRHGHVNLKFALIVAIGLFLGAWIGARFANRLPGPHLRLAFGMFVICLGIYVIYDAVKRFPATQ